MIFIVSLQRFLNKILSIMKDNITLSELELPQLRQMVLENSQRINKKETQINEMNMKISEQEQKDREREEWWEEARREEERARQAHNRDNSPVCGLRLARFCKISCSRLRSAHMGDPAWSAPCPAR